ncbi:hypothetical protein A3F06_03990 [candidate division TM6 bacterium RIFCSPHIGHO2_12_FULL_36_22]|nr:MAG: hypothetical protein A3F06_03990 [candidate division TM6 bacterium RIFCSPHIGHO2_12_FULL_36_22]
MRLILCFILAFGYVSAMNALFSAPDYYRTPLFFGKTDPVCPWQFKIETAAFGGNSSEGFNGCGKKVPLLSIYGLENIKDLAEGAPESILAQNSNTFLNTLYTNTTGANFGKGFWSGSIENFEWDITFLQNFDKGFFLELFIPYRSIELSDVKFHDLSIESEAGTINFSEWKTFVQSLNSNLSQYGLNIGASDTSGVGDIVLMLGWSFCFYDSCMLEKWKVNAIETTLKVGSLFSSSNTVPFGRIFSFSRGYNGHTAYPVIFNGTIYFRKWVSFGAHISGIFFGSRHKSIGMKTAAQQNGWVKLAHGRAKIDRGPIWTLGAYIQTNIYPGFSFLFGTSYVQEEETVLTPCNTDVFKCKIINNDSRLEAWEFGMFHFQLEYDFTSTKYPKAPYIYGFASVPFHGKRVFDTSLFGGTFGINCVWKF